MKSIAEGIWRIEFGTVEDIVPSRFKSVEPMHCDSLPRIEASPIDFAKIKIKKTARGFQVIIPIAENEQFYGLGLQLKSHNQRGKKKKLRVNSDPTTDLGDSHAPVPFILSTAGYGILADTARNVIFDVGSSKLKSDESNLTHNTELHTNTDDLYANRDKSTQGVMIIEVPCASGVSLEIFGGPTILDALRRYVLYSGGGAIPPRYGLGTWYRPKVDFSQEQVVDIASQLVEDNMPIDIIGLEPGWLSTSYPCSYLWDSKQFHDPKAMIDALTEKGFMVNNWIHAFLHKTNPLYEKLYDLSGDYFTFHGLTPDFLIKEVRDMVTDFYDSEHVSLGVSGYKLDECDSSDYLYGNHWAFPECSEFPSGADGEQYHNLFGIQYQRAVHEIFLRKNQRTIGQVRCSHSYAAPSPFFLYSDLYDHHDFVRGVANCGFSGLLWSPEVRDAVSSEDLIRRIQAVILSPHSLINAWYISNCPWKQWDMNKNNSNELLAESEELTARCRELLSVRQSLIPYLYSAFFKYYLTGVPPFRGMVLDYPKDENCFDLEDQYMIGDSLLAAPVISGDTVRKVYLPQGVWYNFFTNERFDGGKTYVLENIDIDTIPLFVKSGAILPLAKVTRTVNEAASFDLTVKVYGNGENTCCLYEDNDRNYDYKKGAFVVAKLTWDNAAKVINVERECSNENCDFPQYKVISVEQVS